MFVSYEYIFNSLIGTIYATNTIRRRNTEVSGAFE